MARLYVFDDRNSVFHSLLGMLAGFVVRTLPLVTVLLVLIFTIYEAQEPENPVATLGDFTEFFVGFLLGLPIAYLEVSL